MKTLGGIFSSAAKTDILYALYRQPEGVGLRQLARISGVRPHSAELALRALILDNLANRLKKGNRVFYELHRYDPRATIVSKAFDAAASATIREESLVLADKAKSILPFIMQAKRMLGNAGATRL
jgi:hypothetical protein